MNEILNFPTHISAGAQYDGAFQSELDYQNLSDADMRTLAAEELDYSQLAGLTSDEIFRLSERLQVIERTCVHHDVPKKRA